MFSDFKISLVLGVQKVANFLVVNFNVGDLDYEFEVWVGGHLLVRANEELHASLRDNALVRAIYTEERINRSVPVTIKLTYIHPIIL